MPQSCTDEPYQANQSPAKPIHSHAAPIIDHWSLIVLHWTFRRASARRPGWLAQLVRAPVSHTGGHRFESCAAHFRTRNWEVGTRNTGGEPFGPNELPLLFRVPRSHFRVRLLDASRSRSLPHLSST